MVNSYVFCRHSFALELQALPYCHTIQCWFLGCWFLILWFHDFCFYGFMVSWLYGLLALWCYGFMVSWFYGFMVWWFCGCVVLWFYGFMVLWFRGFKNFPNYDFMFFDRYWSHIQDFRDSIRRIVGFCRRPSFRKLSNC